MFRHIFYIIFIAFHHPTASYGKNERATQILLHVAVSDTSRRYKTHVREGGTQRLHSLDTAKVACREKLKDIKQRPKYNLKKIEEEISMMEELLEEKRDLRYEPEYYQDSSMMQKLDEEIDDIHNKIHALEVKWEEAMLFEESRKN